MKKEIKTLKDIEAEYREAEKTQKKVLPNVEEMAK